MPKDIRMDVRVRNNLILLKMEGAGITNVAELCRQMAAKFGYTSVHGPQVGVGRLINMRDPARLKDGSWCALAVDLAYFFRCLPEDLFSDFQQEQALEKNRASAEIGFAEFQQIAAAHQTPEIAFQKTELYEAVQRALGTLTAREERVLRLRFGFLEEGMSLEEVGMQLGVTWLRVRQIEAKALRKLKHPSRSFLLRQLLDDGVLENT